MVIRGIMEETNKLNSFGNRRGMSANSRENLSKPGHTNNPNGRLPSSLSIISLVKEELARVPTLAEDGFDGKGHNNAWWIARNAVRDARKGDRTARQDVWDRVEGKVTIPIEPVGKNGTIATFMLVMPDGNKRTAKELAGGDNALKGQRNSETSIEREDAKA